MNEAWTVFFSVATSSITLLVPIIRLTTIIATVESRLKRIESILDEITEVVIAKGR